MAKFNLRDLNPGTKFDYPDGGWIVLRPLTSSVLKDAIEKTTETRVEYKRNEKTGETERISFRETPDAKKGLYAEMLWDYTIKDWGDMTDQNDQHIPCNRENKILFMREEPNFFSFVETKMKIINDEMEKRAGEGEVVKNS